MNELARDAHVARSGECLSRPTLDEAMQRLLLPICDLLDRIASGGTAVTADSNADSAATSARENGAVVGRGSGESLERRIEHIEAMLGQFREEVLARFDQIAAPVQDSIAPAEDNGAPPATDDVWDRILLGEELCGDPALEEDRQQFLNEVVEGVGAARALAAQIMLAQAAPMDELPEMLKHVGEAYYRWRPRTTCDIDPMEEALARWLARRVQTVGLRNSIQLVRPGERFDSNRHVASGRGVEIVAVHGWVVLRDGNKVYTRASVSVR